MQTVQRPEALRKKIRQVKKTGRRIGFVPTMGAFHEGHLSLIRKAREETDFVVVSIFVNPIQFERRADFLSYPRVLAHDARLASRCGTDLLFFPSASEMYPPDFQTFVDVARLSQPWEGSFRKGHFRGVATVLTKLFHLVQPDVAYFGQKDAQQARIVQQLVQDLNFDIRIRILPTVRDPDGLAMSSRNALLSPGDRRRARVLFEALQEARRLIQWGERRGGVISRRMKRIVSQVPQVKWEYGAIVDPKTLQAVKTIRGPVWALLALWIGKVRLIDQATLIPR